VTLEGTEAVLSSYLSTPGNLKFLSGDSGNTLTVSVQEKSGNTVISQTTKTAPLHAFVVSGDADIEGDPDQIRLTADNGNELGGVFIEGSGVNSTSFKTTFDVITGKSSGGADGLSYSFSANGSAAGTSPDAELGTGNGFTLSLRTYSDGGAGGGEGIRLYYGDASRGRAMTGSVGNSQLLAFWDNVEWRGTTARVTLEVTTAGRAIGSITIGGNSYHMFDEPVPAAYLTADRSSWDHIFKARTGSSSDRHAIDNVAISGAGYPNATSPLISSLPSSLAISSGVLSSLVFTGADLDDGNVGADESLVLTLLVTSGTLSAASGSGVVVAGTNTARTLTGTASALEAFLQAGLVTYTGTGESLSIELARASAPSQAKVIAVATLSPVTQAVGGNASVTLA
jgi:hypothetical protein